MWHVHWRNCLKVYFQYADIVNVAVTFMISQKNYQTISNNKTKLKLGLHFCNSAVLDTRWHVDCYKHYITCLIVYQWRISQNWNAECKKSFYVIIGWVILIFWFEKPFINISKQSKLEFFYLWVCMKYLYFQFFVYLHGLFTSPLSSPGPTARTLWAPPSVIGPTVNWKGLPENHNHQQLQHSANSKQMMMWH